MTRLLLVYLAGILVFLWILVDTEWWEEERAVGGPVVVAVAAALLAFSWPAVLLFVVVRELRSFARKPDGR